MKLEPRLPPLPSIGELLDHPRVKGIVDRINRSTIAQRATGFLEELKDSLADKTGVEVPSVTQLAERLARRLLGEPTSDGPIINATGVVVGNPLLAPPLPEAAVHAVLSLAGEYHRRNSAILEPSLRRLCRLAGCEAAVAFTQYAIAVAHATALGEQRSAKVDAEPLAGLIDPATYGYASMPTIAARIADGAELVVVDGGGLIGGPACGLVMGRRSLIEELQRQLSNEHAAIGTIEATALHATLAAYGDDGAAGAPFHVPVWQCLSAPLANLQQRAERLAPLIAAAANIDSVEPVPVQSPWRGDSAETASSWSIAVRTASSDGAELFAKFQQASPGVAARWTSGAVELDLRSVFPRWDQQLATAAASLVS